MLIFTLNILVAQAGKKSKMDHVFQRLDICFFCLFYSHSQPAIIITTSPDPVTLTVRLGSQPGKESCKSRAE